MSFESFISNDILNINKLLYFFTTILNYSQISEAPTLETKKDQLNFPVNTRTNKITTWFYFEIIITSCSRLMKHCMVTSNNKQFGAYNFSNKLSTLMAIGNNMGYAIWQKGKNHIGLAKKLWKCFVAMQIYRLQSIYLHIFPFHSDNSFYKKNSFVLLQEFHYSSNRTIFFSVLVSLSLFLFHALFIFRASMLSTKIRTFDLFMYINKFIHFNLV